LVDAENIIFSSLAADIEAAFPTAFVTGEKVHAPSSFPCVSIVETDNSTHAQTLDSSGIEKHSNLTYEVEVYSNLAAGRKAQCRAIAIFVDGKFMKMGFTRSFLSPVGNISPAIARYVGRYSAVMGRDLVTYRR